MHAVLALSCLEQMNQIKSAEGAHQKSMLCLQVVVDLQQMYEAHASDLRKQHAALSCLQQMNAAAMSNIRIWAHQKKRVVPDLSCLH